jgi:hypothetical protein
MYADTRRSHDEWSVAESPPIQPTESATAEVRSVMEWRWEPHRGVPPRHGAYLAWSVRPCPRLSLWQFGLLLVSVLVLMLALGSLVPGGTEW